MDDGNLIELYNNRSESAITETEVKYGKYCYSIAHNILRSHEDAQECVNDAYLKLWNSIPPQRPKNFCTFLGRIIRNIAINRYNYSSAEKRASSCEQVFDEAAELIPDTHSGSGFADELALKEAINSFLASLSRKHRIIFVRRYWYMSGLREIAEDMHETETSVKVILHRTRKKFKDHLEREGIVI